jgi:hypothetical protein
MDWALGKISREAQLTDEPKSATAPADLFEPSPETFERGTGRPEARGGSRRDGRAGTLSGWSAHPLPGDRIGRIGCPVTRGWRECRELTVGQTITVRTLDMGGDKEFAWCVDEREKNPQLGLRSIRFSLHHPELFREQLRAILRGGPAAQDSRIVFPMIGSLEEFRAARTVVDLAIASLKEEGLPHHPYPRLGMMIEVPSVVSLMEEFACEADCFSLGTNDFVQYLLGGTGSV